MIMPSAIDILERNVVAAADLIASLRESVERSRKSSKRFAPRRRSSPLRLLHHTGPALVEELEPIARERVSIRDGIRRSSGKSTRCHGERRHVNVRIYGENYR